MNFDLQRVLESKQAYRRKLAARPVVEKLRLLDELRARALVIRRASTPPCAATAEVEEASAPYRIGDSR